jgi:hypothetical protein
MLDWYGIAANALWIFALALVLAVLGFAYWEKEVTGERLRLILSRSRSSMTLNGAGGVFYLGLAATSGALWEKILWSMLAGLYVFRIWNAVRSRKSRPG